MRTALKFLGAALAIMAVLVIGAYVYVSSFDVKALIAPVQSRVKEATGRDLQVRGGARIALSMHPRVVLTDVVLGNAPWGAAKDMLTAERLEVELALLPLLSKQYEILEIALVGPVVALETSASGEHNWDFTKPGAATVAAPATGASALPAAFGVANLVVSNGRVTFRDGATGGVTPVNIERLALRARSRATPIAAEFRGTIDDVPVALEGTFGSIDALLAKKAPFPVDVKGEVAGQRTALVTNIGLDGTLYQLRDLRLNVGANALTGSFAVDTGGARPRIQFELAGPVLALAALPLPVPRSVTQAPAAASAPAKDGAPKATGKYLFSDEPINFSVLRMADAAGGLAVGRLTLPDGRAFEHLKLVFALDNGRLDVTSFSLALMGGSVSGSATVDARTAGAAVVTTQLTGTGLALGDILAAVGQKRDVKGGKTDVSAQLSMRGASLHAWASTATGNVRAVVGRATLLNTKLDLDQVFDRLTQAVNPFRESQPSTELECAVVRLPLANGIANVDRSIAMETKELGLSASGTLDFRNETLDFTFKPQVRKGISVAIPNLADLVRFSGPFAAPQVKVDAAGSAKAIASIGAAVGTGGLSALGQALFAWSEGSGPGPCQVALGAPAGSARTAADAKANQNAVAPIANDLGKALGKLFGR